jgi:hypothetical protein
LSFRCPGGETLTFSVPAGGSSPFSFFVRPGDAPKITAEVLQPGPVSRFLVELPKEGAGTQAHRISREEARVLLTQFVNEEFKRKTLAEAHLPREGSLAWPRMSEQDWRLLEFSKGRWVIATERQPPDPGFYVRASVDEFGKNPQLEAAKFYMP